MEDGLTTNNTFSFVPVSIVLVPASVVAISGSPGTGKTSVANRLRQMGFFVINLFDFAKKYGCVAEYDEERDAHVIDEDKLQDALRNYLNAGYGITIIESHYADLIPEEFVIKCFVLSASVSELKSRYKERGYDTQKLEENIQAEIMQVCWTDALDAFGPRRVTKVDVMPIEEIADMISLYSQIDLNRQY